MSTESVRCILPSEVRGALFWRNTGLEAIESVSERVRGWRLGAGTDG